MKFRWSSLAVSQEAGGTRGRDRLDTEALVHTWVFPGRPFFLLGLQFYWTIFEFLSI